MVTKKHLGATPNIMRRHHRLSGMVSQGLLQDKQLYLAMALLRFGDQ